MRLSKVLLRALGVEGAVVQGVRLDDEIPDVAHREILDSWTGLIWSSKEKADGGAIDRAVALTLCEDLNMVLPEIRHWATIIDAGLSRPTMPRIFYDWYWRLGNSRPQWYWTSTPAHGDHDWVWVVDPYRLDNIATYTQQFGTGHVLCIKEADPL